VGDTINGYQSQDNCGHAVRLSADGNTLIDGCANANANGGTTNGKVRVFEKVNNRWQAKGDSIIGIVNGEALGSTVDISGDGDRIVMGAPNDSVGFGEFSQTGRVEAYQWSGSVWVPWGDTLRGSVERDAFGTYVSLSSDGNTLAVGATNGLIGNGRVELYREQAGAFVRVGNPIYGESDYENSGVSLSLSSTGDALAIGANLSASTEQMLVL
jgi:hypothetical protein